MLKRIINRPATLTAEEYMQPFAGEIINGQAQGLTNVEHCYGCGTVQNFKGYCTVCKSEKDDERFSPK
jgi:recombinational DNA repair protein RecR